MIDARGIILSGDIQITPVTNNRSVSALPVAGTYRLIDFVLSSMANSGIKNVGVVASSNYTSLMDHIKSGKPWDLDRKDGGLTILPPNMQKVNYGVVRGDVDVLAGVYDYINKATETYVILSIGNSIYNINFEDVLEKHIENQADITAVYKDMPEHSDTDLSRFTLFDVNDEEIITDIEVEPLYPKTTKTSLGIYVMEKALLCSILDECIARGEHDLLKDAVIKKLSALRMFGYAHTGYTDKIDSLKTYFRNNMIFLNKDIRDELFNSENPIYTKSKDRAPAKYGCKAEIQNSLISDGCIIEGKVENSVLSRGVYVAKGAVVKNSILMQDSVVDEDVCLDHVIFDKEVHVTKGRRLIGQDSYPLAIEKGGII